VSSARGAPPETTLPPLIVTLLAGLAATLLTPVASWAGRGLALVDTAARDPDGRAVPRTGGWVLIVVWLLANPQPSRLTFVLFAVWLIGLHDDRYQSSAKVRAVLIAILAMALAVPGQPLLAAATGTLWVAAVVVAFDFVDGIDGLAPGLGALAGLGLVLLGGPGGAAIGGACLGLLLWNRPTARIHLGNNGSNALGLLVGGLTLPFIQLGQPLPAIALVLVPLVDLVVSLVRRFRSPGNPFGGDRLHLHHQALRAGGPVRGLLRLLLVAAIAVGLAAGNPWLAAAGMALLTAGLLPLAVWSRDPDATLS